MSALHVGMHFANDSLLRLRQLEGEVVMVEVVERLANPREPPSHTFLLAFAGVGHDDELDEEEFFELESHVCGSQFVGCGGVVSGTKRFVEGHEVQPVDEVLRQSFGKCPGKFAEKGTREVLQRA